MNEHTYDLNCDFNYDDDEYDNFDDEDGYNSNS